ERLLLTLIKVSREIFGSLLTLNFFFPHFLVSPAMCFLIPAEISAVLTSFVWMPLCVGLVVICGNCCDCGRGCSAARRGLAGVKNDTTDRAMISRVAIRLDIGFSMPQAKNAGDFIVRARCREANSYISISGLNSFTV